MFDSIIKEDKIKKYLWIILLLIPLIISTGLRSEIFFVPGAEWMAEEGMNQDMINRLVQQIDQQYPHLSPNNKINLLNEKLDLLMKTPEYAQQKESLKKYIQELYRDNGGNAYFIGIDAYFWYRQVENILDHNYPSEKMIPIIKGRYVDPTMPKEQLNKNYYNIGWDTQTLAPNGRMVKKELLPYLEAGLYKICQVFYPKISLMKVVFFTPVFLTMLVIISVFFLTKKLAGDLAAFFASLLIAVNPVLFARTAGGLPDTDTFTILFPLLIISLFVWSTYSDKSWKIILYASLSGILVGVFSFAWSGWFFFFDIFLFCVFCYSIYLLYKKEITKKYIFTILSFFLTSIPTIYIFRGKIAFVNLILNPLVFLKFRSAKGIIDIWPAVGRTIEEQAVSSPYEIVAIMSVTLFLFSLISIIYILWKKEYKIFFLFGLWFLASIPIIHWGLRYAQLLLPPLVIICAITISPLIHTISIKAKEHLDINKKFMFIFILSLFLLLPITQIVSCHSYAKLMWVARASMDDEWFDVLQKIDQETDPNTIITSWWDFGHWFTSVAKRRTTFDGASQNTPQFYWVGRLLSTSDEDEAIAILRMLDCDGSEAFYKLKWDLSQEDITSINHINKMINMTRLEAEIYLKSITPNKDVTPVLDSLFCNPPPALLITSDDMLHKSIIWKNAGSWNFETRSMLYNDYTAGDKSSEEWINNTLYSNLHIHNKNMTHFNLLYESEYKKVKVWEINWNISE